MSKVRPMLRDASNSPIRMKARELWRCVALTLISCMLCASCSSTRDRQELPSDENVGLYPGSWEYRYGDSPRLRDGRPAWADAQNSDGEWRQTSSLYTPSGRNGQGFLWLRTRLPTPALRDGRLLLPAVDQALEAYLDGNLIGGFGPMQGKAATRYAGKRPIYLQLGSDYAGKTLALRFYSPHRNIGILGTPYLGSEAPLLISVVKLGLPFVIIAAVFVALGCAVLVLYAVQRGEPLYLLYGTLCLFIGAYLLSRSLMRAFFFEEPQLWRFIEFGGLCLIVAGFAAFVARLVSGVLTHFLRWLSWAFAGYFAVGTTLAASRLIHLEHVLWLFLWLLLFFLAVIVVALIVSVRRGSSEVRILAGGLILTVGAALYSVLGALGIIAARLDARYTVATLFMLTLGFILARRFRAFHKRLEDYSTVLQLSLSSGQDLAPGQHTQLVLAELLRMLRADRAFLFLCRPDSVAVDLVAGRDAKGDALLDPTTPTDHDAKLVDEVLKKRRPLAYQRARSAAENVEAAPRQSVIASPLLARGKLLGVLYLEADAQRHSFGVEDVEILLGLGGHVALTLTAAHALMLEKESAQTRQRLAEQESLLQSAGRMAKGELQASIVVPAGSELAPLAQALEDMRRDLLAKIKQLESSHAAVQRLNEDLGFQLSQRLRRLLELAVKDELEPSAKKRGSLLQSGAQLGENYRVISLLGEGASGGIYEVERITDQRRLAAKVLSGQADKTVTVRFAREAQILASLNHPNIVSIVDVDITTTGVLFLIMELVRGTPLSRCQDRYGDRELALSVLWQLSAGLKVLHERGIVHRDIKPANVLIVNREGQPLVKLVDFGISMLAGKEPTQLQTTAPGLPTIGEDPSGITDGLTGAGALIGTPMYLAPELFQGSRGARPPSDIFSLGVIAFELLSGDMPFTQPPVVSRWREEPLRIPSLATKRADLPPRLIALIDNCLHPDPAQRPTAEQIMDTLDQLAI